MKTTDKFNEILMVANGGYEDIANKLFTDTLGQFSRGFSEKESAMVGGVLKDRIFLRFFDPGRYYGAPNLQLMAVGLEGFGFYCRISLVSIWMTISVYSKRIWSFWVAQKMAKSMKSSKMPHKLLLLSPQKRAAKLAALLCGTSDLVVEVFYSDRRPHGGSQIDRFDELTFDRSWFLTLEGAKESFGVF